MNKEGDCFIPFIMKNKEYETIVYFYLQTKDTNITLPKMAGAMAPIRTYLSYQKLRFRFQKNPIIFHKREAFGTQIILCQLEFNRKNMQKLSSVKIEKLIRLALKKIIDKSQIIADIWYEPELGAYLQKPRTRFPMSFLKEVYKRYIKDGMLVIRDGEQAESFIWEIYEMLNYLFIITKEEEKWEELEAFAYDHTGLIIQYNCMPEHLNRGCRDLYYFDFSDCAPEEYKMLPKGTVYMDFATVKEKQRIIEGKRKDIKYVSYPKCLDTCVINAL